MIGAYLRFIAGLAALAIVCIGLLLATYSVAPGEAVLLLHGNRLVAKDPAPGLHWKIPLIENVVRLDARTQLSAGEVHPAPAGTSGFAARYAVLWRIADPVAFYNATGGDATVAHDQLKAALSPVIGTAMKASGAKNFLSGPTAELVSRISAAVKPAAKKIGISVIGVQIGTAELPSRLAVNVADKMSADTRKEIAAAKAAGQAESKQIASAATAARAAALADARQKAARITGASEAKAAEIYAPAAKKAPAFFRYFLALESEGAALKSHTRVLVISLDSPWFKTLENPDGKRHR